MGGWKKQCLFAIVLSSFLLLAVNGAPESSQDATEYHDEQGDKQDDNDYLAHELANQQDEKPEDDDDSMADQADEPDSDDEDNALEQQDHDDDDQLSAQGRCILRRKYVCRVLACRCWKRKRVCRSKRKWWKRRRHCYWHKYLSWCLKTRCRNVNRG